MVKNTNSDQLVSSWYGYIKRSNDASAVMVVDNTTINLEKLTRVLKYPEMIEAIADVLEYGVKKGYEDENWLKPDGKRMSRKENADSMFHHLASNFSGSQYDDQPGGSGLLHLSQLMTRSGMELTRIKRGIKHPDDESATKQEEKTSVSVELCSKKKTTHSFPKSYACKSKKCRCKKDK